MNALRFESETSRMRPTGTDGQGKTMSDVTHFASFRAKQPSYIIKKV